MMQTIQFFSYLRKKIAKKQGNKIIYQYYITVPNKIIEAFELEKLVNKKVKVIIEEA